jgi:hypothetical protein
MITLNLRICALALVAAGVMSSCASKDDIERESCPRVEFGAFHLQQLDNTRPVRGPEGQVIYFEHIPIASLQDISQAQLGGDEATVLMAFKPAAAERLKSATTGHSGVRLALVVDDEAPMAVVWEGDYGIEDGRMQYSFRSKDTAQELVRTISRCMEGNND